MFHRFINYLGVNWVGIVLFMVILLFAFWALAFFSNGLLGTKFDLQSCWAGVAAISTAGVVGLAKYWTDSTKNSEEGKPIQDFQIK